MLELRRIDDHHIISIEADVGFLDLESIDAERSALVTAGEAAVDRYFTERLGPFDPVEAERILSAIAAFAREALRITGFVRACAVLPFDDEYFRVAAAANMSEDADDQLLIRRSSVGVASAFREKEPVIVTVAAFDEALRRDPRYKYEHQRARRPW